MKRLKTSLKHLLRLLKTNFSMTRFSKKLLARKIGSVMINLLNLMDEVNREKMPDPVN